MHMTLSSPPSYLWWKFWSSGLSGTILLPWIYFASQLDSILYTADLITTSSLWYFLLTFLASPEVKSKFSTYNLSLTVRCDTGHFCWCNFFLNVVSIFDLGVSFCFADYSGGADGYGGKSILVSSIRKCVVVFFMSLIIQTWTWEERYDFDFVYIWNSMRLRAQLGVRLYLYHVSYYM